VQVFGDFVFVTANTGSHDEGEDDHSSHGGAVVGQNSRGSGDSELGGVFSRFSTGMVLVGAHGDEPQSEHMDQLVIMDAKSHEIVRRVDVGFDAHLAHVVSDGEFAYVTATNSDELVKVSLSDWGVSSVSLPEGSAPHGLRLGDGFAAIAGMGGVLLLVDLGTNVVESVNVSGMLVQSAVVGDDVFVSVFDSDELVRYNVKSKKLDRFKLGSAGPIQLYPSVDGEFIYVADQGNMLGKPVGSFVFKVDARSGEIVSSVESGAAPHGVVVSPDGRVWVTNLLDNSVSVLSDDGLFKTVQVGVAPNGVSFWSEN
jgi:DNA-binding beta-propeller fold protein YncE